MSKEKRKREYEFSSGWVDGHPVEGGAGFGAAS